MIGPDPVESILDRAVDLLQSGLGLRSDPALVGRLRRCLRDETTARDLQPEAYIEAVASDGAIRQCLFDRVTVQETSFFRHPGQFEMLAHVLPDLPRPISIWSAGSANGQEAYSLAMVLEEQALPGGVIATDVSTQAVERTVAARYATRELTGLSQARRGRHLVERAADWEITASVRERVTAHHYNLVSEHLPARLASCQVVFCRNVLIYFSPEHATVFLKRLADQLAAGALLFLGYAETIWQVTDLWEPIRVDGAFPYHRRRQHPAAVPFGPDRETMRPARRLSRPGPRNPAPNAPVAARRGRGGAKLLDATRPPTSSSLVEELTRTGQIAAADRDYPTAISAFRKCVYLAPDDPMGHLHLGLVLEAAGDPTSAARAFAAARVALDLSPSFPVAEALGGYRIEELIAMLNDRQDPS